MGTQRSGTSTQHRSELGEWERVWQRPSRRLRGLVDGYHGYRQRLTAPAVHRGVPTAVLPLVISFGPPQTVTHGDGTGHVTVDSFVAGLYDRHVFIEAAAYHGIQVDLRPVAAARLLALPLRELSGRTVPLEALLGRGAERLADDLASAPDWPSRFRRLDRELVTWLADTDGPGPEVTHAWRRLTSSRGTVPIRRIADEVGWSPRHLRERFGWQLGLPPKRMARLVRFEHAADRLSQPGPHELAEIAVTTGFYDQSHLTNEVRAFTGLAPTDLITSHLPDSGGVFHLDP